MTEHKNYYTRRNQVIAYGWGAFAAAVLTTAIQLLTPLPWILTLMAAALFGQMIAGCSETRRATKLRAADYLRTGKAPARPADPIEPPVETWPGHPEQDGEREQERVEKRRMMAVTAEAGLLFSDFDDGRVLTPQEQQEWIEADDRRLMLRRKLRTLRREHRKIAEAARYTAGYSHVQARVGRHAVHQGLSLINEIERELAPLEGMPVPPPIAAVQGRPAGGSIKIGKDGQAHTLAGEDVAWLRLMARTSFGGQVPMPSGLVIDGSEIPTLVAELDAAAPDAGRYALDGNAVRTPSGERHLLSAADLDLLRDMSQGGWRFGPQDTTLPSGLAIPAADLGRLIDALAARERALPPTYDRAGRQLTGRVVMDPEQVSQLQAAAREGERAAGIARRRAGDALIAQAVADGKISEDRAAHWIKVYLADPAGCTEQITQMAPGVVSRAGAAPQTPELRTEHFGPVVDLYRRGEQTFEVRRDGVGRTRTFLTGTGSQVCEHGRPVHEACGTCVVDAGSRAASEALSAQPESLAGKPEGTDVHGHPLGEACPEDNALLDRIAAGVTQVAQIDSASPLDTYVLPSGKAQTVQALRQVIAWKRARLAGKPIRSVAEIRMAHGHVINLYTAGAISMQEASARTAELTAELALHREAAS